MEQMDQVYTKIDANKDVTDDWHVNANLASERAYVNQDKYSVYYVWGTTTNCLLKTHTTDIELAE